MFDLRPVGYVSGLLVAALGATMLVPMGLDMVYRNGHWLIFLESAVLTVAVGASVAVACANGVRERMTLQQTFLVTTSVWLILPVFGALPFILGPPDATVVDAFFEAMSGMTTTGATVFTELETLPEGTLLWRSMLQWFGGVGIIVVAMAFLPELRVGGMQIFRSEAFDTGGKVLPRAAEIASRISVIYVVLTGACALAYLGTGLSAFDALNHALTTISTGGFSTSDASFGAFQGAPEYVASVFMILASLPFVRFVQIAAGQAQPIFVDSQVRTYLWIIAILVCVMALYRVVANGDYAEHAFREGLFNVTSIISGTGYASVDYQLWGGFAVVAFFFIGLIGGCAGSTACSIKVFRYQLLFASIRAQVGKIHAPHGVFTPRFEGRPVGADVLNSVMSFFVAFIVLMGVTSVLLALTGEDTVTAVSGAAAALANIGPGLGDKIGPAGNFSEISETGKWLLSLAMLVGRLEVMAVLVILTARFWRG
ncbi:TrkH family potassium uptake protein [Psychromarinibacter sp. C21-152]|uniref:Trk system potassium uptake protein n=1 Tax=Psychromarinibacter sediminicola TaxID=3033385 RepID=A0AAE3NRG8_9RHOB|nr:TrkH family potassium uptake protein [Psychromarinibacter sediminicola]MDF0602928.1 TrkH family potassium uptake protein [Psychromarinibacter sediminicola]